MQANPSQDNPMRLADVWLLCIARSHLTRLCWLIAYGNLLLNSHCSMIRFFSDKIKILSPPLVLLSFSICCWCTILLDRMVNDVRPLLQAHSLSNQPFIHSIEVCPHRIDIIHSKSNSYHPKSKPRS
jgi:hypothetical protein